MGEAPEREEDRTAQAVEPGGCAPPVYVVTAEPEPVERTDMILEGPAG